MNYEPGRTLQDRLVRLLGKNDNDNESKKKNQ